MKARFLIAMEGPPRLKSPGECTSDFLDFIAKCTTMQPDRRPSAAEMLKHRFLQRAAYAGHMGRTFSVVEEFREKENRRYQAKKKVEAEQML